MREGSAKRKRCAGSAHPGEQQFGSCEVVVHLLGCGLDDDGGGEEISGHAAFRLDARLEPFEALGPELGEKFLDRFEPLRADDVEASLSFWPDCDETWVLE